MADVFDTLKLRAGNKSGMTTLPDRSPAFVRDEKALYIGTPNGNLMLCKADTLQDVETLKSGVKALGESDTAMQARITQLGNTDTQMQESITQLINIDTQIQASVAQLSGTVDKKLTASPAAAQAELGDDAELAAVVSAFNALLAALKDGGIMNE